MKLFKNVQLIGTNLSNDNEINEIVKEELISNGFTPVSSSEKTLFSTKNFDSNGRLFEA